MALLWSALAWTEAQLVPPPAPPSGQVVPDIALDLDYCDFLRPFTLRMPGRPDVAVAKMLDEPVTWKEMEASNGQVIKGDMKMIWSAVRYPIQPPIGSLLIDDGGRYWTGLSLTYKDQVQLWEMTVRNLSINAGAVFGQVPPLPSNLATIIKASYRKGDANEAKATWRGAISDLTPPTDSDVIQAHFQPSAESAMIFLGSEYTKTTYRVYFAKPCPIELASSMYRLVDSNGYHYKVQMYSAEQRLDVLPVAIATRILEGVEYWGNGPPSGQ